VGRVTSGREMVVPPPALSLAVPSDYQGDVFIWDLDKTYLRTEFKTLRQLVRTALQKASDKVTYPGAAALLRALRKGPNGAVRPIFFVSASPPQLGDVLREKFLIDGVEIDGIYFKDNLRNLRPGRLERLKEQMGYKLLALLDLRRRLPGGAIEVFFGDDVETDVAIYALYAQMMRGVLRGPALVELLEHQGVFHDEAARIAWRSRRLVPRPPPERIFIQVHRQVDPRYYRRFGAGVMATTGYFQTALVLHAEGRLELDAVASVAIDVLRAGGQSREDLLDQLDTLVRRHMLSEAAALPLIKELAARDLLPPSLA
jgi:hypothetical protein